MRNNRLSYILMTVAALALMSVLNHGSARAADQISQNVMAVEALTR